MLRLIYAKLYFDRQPKYCSHKGLIKSRPAIDLRYAHSLMHAQNAVKTVAVIL